MKPRLAIVGAGLCGSLIAALLRDRFDVTVVERGRTPKPLFTDVNCAAGEVNTSINRAEGLGGTTNYWHNALIELADNDLRKAGIPADVLRPYYETAWSLFLDQDERSRCERIRHQNAEAIDIGGRTTAHMVLPRIRANLWELANRRYPGRPITVVHGTAVRVGSDRGHPQVEVETSTGTVQVAADALLLCGGGFSTPALLARSLGDADGFCPGYHDHPMAYVAKIQLRPDSHLKAVSCTTTSSSEVRAGIVYESADLKTVVYLRPALDLRLRSIQGPARFILSDLRNDPFSPRKILALLKNLEAVREAILFKSGAGFRGDYFSVLLLGEQHAAADRGLTLRAGGQPSLNWHVSDAERTAYQAALAAFLRDFSSDIIATNLSPVSAWEFRTAAHHSGMASRFLSPGGDLDLSFFSVHNLPGTFVCDGSLLRASGIANSGLTLVALGYRLAELLAAAPAGGTVVN